MEEPHKSNTEKAEELKRFVYTSYSGIMAVSIFTCRYK